MFPPLTITVTADRWHTTVRAIIHGTMATIAEGTTTEAMGTITVATAIIGEGITTKGIRIPTIKSISQASLLTC